MAEINIRKNRYRWNVLASANFFFGGLGAGLFLMLWLTSFWANVPPPSPLVRFIPLMSAMLVILGFAAVGLEAGRPLRGIYLGLNLATAWMSREVLFGGMFVFGSLISYPFQSTLLGFFTVLSAGLFLFSQAMVLYRSQGIENWHVGTMPALLMSADLIAAYGLCLLLGMASSILMVCGLIVIGFHMLLSVIHLSNENRGGGAGQRHLMKRLLGSDLLGVWLPFALTLLMLLGEGRMAAGFSALCGLCATFGMGLKIHRIVCNSPRIRKMTIETPLPQAVGNGLAKGRYSRLGLNGDPSATKGK